MECSPWQRVFGGGVFFGLGHFLGWWLVLVESFFLLLLLLLLLLLIVINLSWQQSQELSFAFRTFSNVAASSFHGPASLRNTPLTGSTRTQSRGMKDEAEEVLLLVSNNKLWLVLCSFWYVRGANFKAIERSPHFWCLWFRGRRLATDGPPEPTDKLTKQPPNHPTRTNTTATINSPHLNERSPQADTNLDETVAKEYSSVVAFIYWAEYLWWATYRFLRVGIHSTTVAIVASFSFREVTRSIVRHRGNSSTGGGGALSFRVPLSSQSTPLVGFSTKTRGGMKMEE